MATASDLKADRRVVKCPGCKTPSEDHLWGIPSKFCEGFKKSSPKKEMETSPTSETVFSALAAELESLELEEEELRRQEEESKLRKRIADKRKLIERLRKSGSGDAAGEDNTPRLTIKDLPKVYFSNAEGRTPLDEFLAGWEDQPQFRPTDSIWQRAGACEGGRVQSSHQPSSTEMFLKPMKTAKGEKPLLIIDFVNNIVPQEQEETLGNQGSAKIVVTYGPKKPKLESTSIPQWVVANTRIFYTLLSEGKLSTQSAIQDYLAYTVKIMELIARYDWKSILMYDNEFRKLQAIYKFSWSFDSTHLHTVLLQPIYKPNPPTANNRLCK